MTGPANHRSSKLGAYLAAMVMLLATQPLFGAQKYAAAVPWFYGLCLISSLVLACALVVVNRRLVQAQRQLEREAAWRERLVTDLPVGVYELLDNPVGAPSFVYVSERTEKLLGVTRSELESDFMAAFRNIHPDDVGQVLELNSEARSEGNVFRAMARIVLDGKTSWIQVQSRPRQVDKQRRWAGIITDVTEQVTTARELAEAEARFRILFEQSPMSIIIHESTTGAVVDANRAAWEGYGLDSLKAFKARNLWADPPYSEADAVERIQAAMAGKADSFEWVSVDVHGRPFRELVTLTPVLIDGQQRVVSSSIDITELHTAQQRFRAIFDASPVAVTVHDADSGKILEANTKAWKSWGFDSLEDMLTNANRIWMDGPYDQKAALARMHAALERGGDRFVWPGRRRDGSVAWHEVSVSPLYDQGRRCCLSVAVDITIRREAERLLRESDERFRTLLRDIPGVAIWGIGVDGTVNYWNRTAEKLYGYAEKEAIGKSVQELIIPCEDHESFREEVEQVSRGGDARSGEAEMGCKNGSRVPVFSSRTAVQRDGLPTELFSIDIDLSERKRYENELVRIANYDGLTGLPNRTLLAELMREHCAVADRSGEGFALCYLDLDEFKPINDQFGHDVGDRVLITIADRLRSLIRGSDVVGRLGGDEFVLLLSGLQKGDDLERRLRTILDHISEPIKTDSLTVQVAASIGVTLYPEDPSDPDILLRHADQAMYRAKTQSRNVFSLFDLALEEQLQRRRDRLATLGEAMRENQFVLYYHPKISLRSGEVCGVEGLVRWQHPEAGVLGPAAFLSDLEQSELESEFGAYIIEQALAQAETWIQQGLFLPVSVNISGPHLLSPGFVSSLSQALQRHPQMLPEMFQIEVVETAAMVDLNQAIDVLGRVRQLGVTVSLDDFGTGYSSLSHLRSLPVDEVKIDQSFVRDMLTDRGDFNIVQSVLGLASAFKLRAVAEGVESPEQMQALVDLDCELGQGYVFARPMPADELARWLAQWPEQASSMQWRVAGAEQE